MMNCHLCGCFKDETTNPPEIAQYGKKKIPVCVGCVDAINLDGGGSTTMWTKDKVIVNFPSDKTGERPVSNALLIINK